MVWMMAWKALSATLQGYQIVESEHMLEGCYSQEPWRAEEIDWKGPYEVLTKVLVKLYIWGRVTPFSIKDWALNE